MNSHPRYFLFSILVLLCTSATAEVHIVNTEIDDFIIVRDRQPLEADIYIVLKDVNKLGSCPIDLDLDKAVFALQPQKYSYNFKNVMSANTATGNQGVIRQFRIHINDAVRDDNRMCVVTHIREISP